MTPFDRREFVRRLALTAGASALPAWIARGMAQDPVWQDPADGSPRLAALRAARRRALAHGKPLLMIVVPSEEVGRWQRGQLFGSLLNHGGKDALLDIALAEPVCATLDEATRVFGRAVRRDDGEPLALVVELGGDGSEPSVTEIDPDLGATPTWPAEGQSLEEWRAAELRYAEQRNARLAAAVHTALAGDRAALVARADACRSTLASDERETLEEFFAGGPTPNDALLMRAAAVVRLAAASPRREGDTERLSKPLLEAARRTLVEARIPGSAWARTEGCGFEVEGSETGAIMACGMGFVPEVDRRFLYFFIWR